MKSEVIIERRVPVTKRLREMKVGQQLYFKGANPFSIKAMASRVGSGFKPARIYSTQTEQGGVAVWRDK